MLCYVINDMLCYVMFVRLFYVTGGMLVDWLECRSFTHSCAVLSYGCVHLCTLEGGQYQLQLYCIKYSCVVLRSYVMYTAM